MKFKSITKIQITFILLGAAGGFLYWRFIGCTSGTCPLQSHWAGSMLLGSVLGSLIGDLFESTRKKAREKKTLTESMEKNEQL